MHFVLNGWHVNDAVTVQFVSEKLMMRDCGCAGVYDLRLLLARRPIRGCLATVQQLVVSHTVRVISSQPIEKSILELIFENEGGDVDKVQAIQDDRSFLVTFTQEGCKYVVLVMFYRSMSVNCGAVSIVTFACIMSACRSSSNDLVVVEICFVLMFLSLLVRVYNDLW